MPFFSICWISSTRPLCEEPRGKSDSFKTNQTWIWLDELSAYHLLKWANSQFMSCLQIISGIFAGCLSFFYIQANKIFFSLLVYRLTTVPSFLFLLEGLKITTFIWHLRKLYYCHSPFSLVVTCLLFLTSTQLHKISQMMQVIFGNCPFVMW